MSGDDTYVVVIEGKPSKPLHWDAALARAKYSGESLGKKVEIHVVRNGETADVVAKWSKFRRTK